MKSLDRQFLSSHGTPDSLTFYEVEQPDKAQRGSSLACKTSCSKWDACAS